MVIKLCFFIFVVFMLSYSWSAVVKDASSCTSYPCLLFDENFDSLDLRSWKHMSSAAATGNFEFQYYTNNRSNSFVQDGFLHLNPTLTNNTFSSEFLTSGTLDLWTDGHCTSNRRNTGCFRQGTPEAIINPIQSAAITTEDSFHFTYGKLEVSAKMPTGDWLWPAIWLMPKHDQYGSWPASGEIDLLESRGNAQLTNNDEAKTHVGNKRILQSLHWGPFYPMNGQPYTLAKTNKKHGTFSDTFHKYTLEWRPDRLVFFLDNKCTLNVTMPEEGSFWQLAKFPDNLHNPWKHGTKLAPFDKNFYIILNLAVGGTNNYFHDTYLPKIPWDNSKNDKAKTDFWNARDQWLPTWSDPVYKIDYVKVWKLEADPKN